MTTADLLTLIHAANCTDAGHHEACDAVRNLRDGYEIAKRCSVTLEQEAHMLRTVVKRADELIRQMVDSAEDYPPTVMDMLGATGRALAATA